MSYVFKEKITYKEYINFLKKQNYLSFMQEDLWAKAKNISTNKIVAVKENDDVVALAHILIRKKNGNKYLKWDSDNNKFVESDNYCFNTQSTYLYALLNGFSLGQNNDIIWEDVPRVKTKDIKVKTRQNVLKSKSDFVYDKIIGEKCTRNWSFTREDEI